MNCHDARELFSALLDEALTPEERARLDAHLAACAECGRELDRFRRTVALVQALPLEPAPPGFVDRVTAAARPEPWPARLARGLLVPWRVKLPLEAAALLLVGGLAVLVFRGTEEQQRAAQLADQRTYLERPAAPERPAATPEFAGRGAEQPAARRDETPLTSQKTPPSSPTTTPPRAPQEPQAPAPSQAPAGPQPLAQPPSAQSQEPPAPKAALRQAPAAWEAMEPSRDVATGRASAPRAEAPATREATPSEESDRLRKAAPSEAPVGSGTVESKSPPGKVSDSVARERKAREDVARDVGAGSLGAARSRPGFDVRGTLAVADARATAASVEAIAGRLKGVVTGRHDDGESLLLQVVVGRERYDELVRELVRLGQWQAATEIDTKSLPPQVRVAIHVVAQRSR